LFSAIAEKYKYDAFGAPTIYRVQNFLPAPRHPVGAPGIVAVCGTYLALISVAACAAIRAHRR
jgi:hypothetical protein